MNRILLPVLGFGLFLSQCAFADIIFRNNFEHQPPINVIARDPARHAPAAARTTNVALTFDQALNAATAANVRVFGAQTGLKAGTASAISSSLTFNPTTDFKPGEVVSVTVPATVLSSGGAAATPHNYQFNTAATGGTTNIGRWQNLATVTNLSAIESVKLADLDADGDLDMVAVSYQAGAFVVSRNDGNGFFTVASTRSGFNGGRSVAVGDVDGDGDQDVAVGFEGSTATNQIVQLLTNDGTGAFVLGQALNVGHMCEDVTLDDFDGDGDLDLASITSRNVKQLVVRINNGTGTFSGTGNLTLSDFPRQFFVGDMDNDGDLDILVRDAFSNVTRLSLNDGAGAFSLGALLPFIIFAGPSDLDGDGDLDLLSSNAIANNIRFNNGTATFTAGPALPFGGTPGLADVDGDGDVDIVGIGNNSLYLVLTNNGSGAFTSTGDLPISNTLSLKSPLMVGDVDGDGDLDFVSGASNGAFTIVFLNQPPPIVSSFTPTIGSTGALVTFAGTNLHHALSVRFGAATTTIIVANTPTSLTVRSPAGATTAAPIITTAGGATPAAGPFTVVSSLNITALSPTRNASAGLAAGTVAVTFDQPLNIATATPGAIRVFAAEVRGRRPGTVSASNSTLTFAASTPFRAGERVAVTMPAVVQGVGGNAAPPSVWQFMAAVAHGTGTFTGTSSVAAGTNPFKLAVGDVNGDGNLDAVVVEAASGANAVLLRLGNGAGGFSGSSSVSVGTGPVAVTLADIDADGDLDFISANASTLSVRRNDGAGGFTPASPDLAVGTGPTRVVVADFDADLDLDLAMVTLSGNRLVVRLNDGTGLFGGGSTLSMNSGDSTRGLEAGDVDSDGDVDILVGYHNGAPSGGVYLYRNNGVATFAAPVSVINFSAEHLTLADVDADGDLDVLLLFSNFSTTNFALVTFLNNGSGSFGVGEFSAVSIGSSAFPQQLTVADVDADGDLDVLIPDRTNNVALLSRNNGSGIFAAPTTTPVGTLPSGLATGDFDNDGDVDFVTANAVDGTLSPRLNQGAAATPPPTISIFTPQRPEG